MRFSPSSGCGSPAPAFYPIRKMQRLIFLSLHDIKVGKDSLEVALTTGSGGGFVNFSTIDRSFTAQTAGSAYPEWRQTPKAQQAHGGNGNPDKEAPTITFTNHCAHKGQRQIRGNNAMANTAKRWPGHQSQQGVSAGWQAKKHHQGARKDSAEKVVQRHRKKLCPRLIIGNCRALQWLVVMGA